MLTIVYGGFPGLLLLIPALLGVSMLVTRHRSLTDSPPSDQLDDLL